MSLQEPFISIGISFYNAEATILDAVRSILAQTYDKWELILIDDGSTDNSLALVQSIDDPRIRVYSDGKNRRLAARLNQITKLAKYDYLARMDADDLISPDRLEKQIKVLLSKPEIDLVSTGLCSLSDNYEPTGIRSVVNNHKITTSRLLMGGAGIVHGSLMGRSDWFRRNPYKESMKKSQDTNLWVRAYSKDDLNVFFIPEPLYYYREDGNVTKEQLLVAYSMGRYTILKDAKKRFKVTVKLKALAYNILKTYAVKFFPSYSLKVARKRRNSRAISMTEKERFQREILYIRNISLELNNN